MAMLNILQQFQQQLNLTYAVLIGWWHYLACQSLIYRGYMGWVSLP